MTDLRVPRVGVSLTAAFLAGADPAGPVRAAGDAGLDHIQVGDHVSFHDGSGFDGMIHATAALSMRPTIPVSVGVYLLALRHPVLVARQMADIERLFPGRLTIGVGVGGEDRHEFEAVGVDPRTRGRRTDESLALLRSLLDGDAVTRRGEFYDLNEVRVSPVPTRRPQILVGGRSDAALRRVARYGDGWLALWVSARRFGDAVATIDAESRTAGRRAHTWRHGLTLWCGVPGPDGRGGERLAAAMESRYRMPFRAFERWCPVGDPDEIAAFVRPYLDAGCAEVTLSLPSETPFEAVDAARQIRERVRGRPAG